MGVAPTPMSEHHVKACQRLDLSTMLLNKLAYKDITASGSPSDRRNNDGLNVVSTFENIVRPGQLEQAKCQNTMRRSMISGGGPIGLLVVAHTHTYTHIQTHTHI